MTEEQLRDLVRWVSGQESTRKLTRYQAKMLIDVLEDKTPVSEYNPLNPPFVSGTEKQRFMRPRKSPKVIVRFLPLASSRQIGLIEELKIEAGYDDEHLKNHVRKWYKVYLVKELDIKQAWAVFNMLKKQKQKRMNEATHVLS